MKRNFFISYRRQSGGDYAKGIFDHLDKQADIGAVFFDRDPKSLPAGSEWPTELISKVLQSDVVLVIIDRSWTDELAKRNKENDEWIKDTDSTDWVRREVMFGLHFGKIVIPLLFEEAKPPTESDLPYDLSKLASKNALWMNLTASEFSNLESHLAETAPASPLSYDPPSEFLTGLTQTEDDLWSENGQEWSPAQSEDSPHRWDYKYTVTNPDERMRLRVALLASQRSGTLDNGFSLADLSKLGQHRCFGHSEKKKGMFIQASCIVTDGRKGKTDHLLMSLRSPTQFHDEVYGDTPIEHSKRFTEGVSCLIGTCLSDFNFHEQTAHLSRAVFNDLQEFNPWAVFSRKLLIPALFVDSRFLGIGYNLNNPDKEYLHFIWHVRTEDCPPAMLVPAREKANFDLASWETLEDVSKYDFAGCGIDRLAVESLLGVSLPWPKKKAPTIFHGFARYQGLEGTQGVHADQAQTWRREAIPIDLIRMFQQERHGGLNQSEIHDAASLKIALVHYLESLKDIKDFTIVLEDGPQEDSTIISLKDRDGEETSCFQVLHYVTETLNLSDDDINTIRDNSLNVLPNGKHPASTLIVQGVRTSQRYTLNGAELLSTSNNAPIHLIKIALEKPVRVLKRVVHAVIPVRIEDSGEIRHCLFTRHEEDETPRLPGGKIEKTESQEQAIKRELKEELDLNPGEFEIHRVILPNGRTTTEVSPSSGELTDYQLIPFLVAPIKSGIQKLQEHLRGDFGKSRCLLKPETFDDWKTSGLGFDSRYANEVMERLTQGALDSAAFDFEKNEENIR